MAEESSRQNLPPGATIGILGGGQLGRMLALAAARLGMRSHIYSPEPDSPAFQIAACHTLAPYQDAAALAGFARSVDVVTYEFENVPAETASIIAGHVAVRPDPSILAITQDRLAEKTFIRSRGLEVADFAPVASLAGLELAAARIGYPCILKTRRFGYDGKGQFAIRDAAALAPAWAAMRGRPALLEAFVPFAKEISVIAARGQAGAVVTYDVPENRHEHHILRSSHVPAGLPDGCERRAREIAATLAEALAYVGVMTVELFLVEHSSAPRLLVNEIAPRVHNSGHWTLDACTISQFELHIRAIAGWPILEPVRHSDVVMTNLLGDEIVGLAALAAEPNAAVHIYGKAESRPGRKMGHVSRLAPRRQR